MSVWLAVSMIPLMMVVGAALDSIRSQGIKSDMQVALDSAYLAAAAASDKTQAEREHLAKNMFAANFSEVDDPPAVSVSFADTEVTVSASYEVDTAFMKLSGINGLSVSASSTAVLVVGERSCIVTLDPSVKDQIMQKSPSSIDANGCLAKGNSPLSKALFEFVEALMTDADSTSRLSASETQAVQALFELSYDPNQRTIRLKR